MLILLTLLGAARQVELAAADVVAVRQAVRSDRAHAAGLMLISAAPPDQSQPRL